MLEPVVESTCVKYLYYDFNLQNVEHTSITTMYHLVLCVFHSDPLLLYVFSSPTSLRKLFPYLLLFYILQTLNLLGLERKWNRHKSLRCLHQLLSSHKAMALIIVDVTDHLF